MVLILLLCQIWWLKMIKRFKAWLLRKAKGNYEYHYNAMQKVSRHIDEDRKLLDKLGLYDIYNTNAVLTHLLYLNRSYEYHSKQLEVYARLNKELQRIK
jgi:hypothetical protein